MDFARSSQGQWYRCVSGPAQEHRNYPPAKRKITVTLLLADSSCIFVRFSPANVRSHIQMDFDGITLLVRHGVDACVVSPIGRHEEDGNASSIDDERSEQVKSLKPSSDVKAEVRTRLRTSSVNIYLLTLLLTLFFGFCGLLSFSEISLLFATPYYPLQTQGKCSHHF